MHTPAMATTIMGGTVMVIIDRGGLAVLSLNLTMARLDLAAYDCSSTRPRKTWVAGLNPAMTLGGGSRS